MHKNSTISEAGYWMTMILVPNVLTGYIAGFFVQPSTFPPKPPQLPLRDRPGFRGHQIPQRIRAIVPADAILIGINLQNVFGFIRVVLK